MESWYGTTLSEYQESQHQHRTLHKPHNIFNRNTIQESYSIMDNMKKPITKNAEPPNSQKHAKQ